ncbi:MAG TPA: hypothetical protein VMR70_04000 [Flavisolibacter sp.]|nr:hypothetical protein [Flavisolibacter sp.]
MTIEEKNASNYMEKFPSSTIEEAFIAGAKWNEAVFVKWYEVILREQCIGFAEWAMQNGMRGDIDGNVKVTNFMRDGPKTVAELYTLYNLKNG